MLSQAQIEETYLQGITAFKPEEVKDLFWKIYDKEKEPFKNSKHFNWHLFFNTIRKRLIDAIENSNISITGSTLDEVKNSIASHREKTTTTKPKAKENKCDVPNLKDELIELLMKDHVGSDWRDYYNKKYQYVLKLENGRYYPIEKPKIDKMFCYPDDWDCANELVQNCYTEKGFFNNNIREFITNYNEHCYVDFKPNTKYVSYLIDDKHNIAYVVEERWKITDQPYYEDYRRYDDGITEKDKENIIKAQNYVLKDFIKRLNTYLKKYGTKGVYAWTYWDEA